MARSQLKDTIPVLSPIASSETLSPWMQASSHGSRHDVSVGQVQAELAQRFAWSTGPATATVLPEERMIRFLSVAGGCTALLAAYAIVSLLLLR